MAAILKNGFHPEVLLALPLCGLHLAVMERLEYSNERERCAGGDFIVIMSALSASSPLTCQV